MELSALDRHLTSSKLKIAKELPFCVVIFAIIATYDLMDSKGVLSFG